MEDGALLLFGRSSGQRETAAAAAWALRWKHKAHAKELKDCAFAADGTRLCTVAPDGQCLSWVLSGGGARTGEPTSVAQPSFYWHREKKKRKNMGAQWRCIAMGEGGDAKGGGPVGLLFGALNHAGGPGWVARCELEGASCQAYVKVSPNPLTALALAADGGLVAVGTSEGELFVLDTRSLGTL